MSPKNELLQEVLSEILERLTFLFAGSVDPKSAWPTGVRCMRVTIAFHAKGRQGELALVIPIVLGREMAANILGVDQNEATDSMAQDAVKELANVVAGAFVVRHFGDSVLCDLEAPNLEIFSAEERSSIIPMSEAIVVQVDEHRISAVVRLRDGTVEA